MKETAISLSPTHYECEITKLIKRTQKLGNSEERSVYLVVILPVISHQGIGFGPADLNFRVLPRTLPFIQPSPSLI